MAGRSRARVEHSRDSPASRERPDDARSIGRVPAAPLDSSTLAVSAARGRGEPGDPLNVPVVLASVYRSGSTPDGACGPLPPADGGRAAYGREANPTWAALEDVLGVLEGGVAHVFASGMGAIEAVFDLLPLGAVVVVAEDVYVGTRARLDDLAVRGRIGVRAVDLTDTDTTLAACDGAALLWLESSSNPLATVAADPELAEELRGRRTLLGAVPGPLETWLALRGVRTLPVRLERAQATAGELARRSLQPGAEHVPAGLVRVSVGCEHVEDLWTDLDRALRTSQGTAGDAP